MLKKLSVIETNITQHKAYSLVSEIYPNLMNEVSYKSWAKYLIRITKSYIQTDSRILELASGSCQLSKILSRDYPNIICTDLSFNMISKGNCDLKIVCDMTKIPFNSNFGMILCTFDSVNYLLTKKKLLNLFQEVNRLLSDEGIFTFDASLEKNSYVHQKNSKSKGKIGNFSYRRKSRYDAEQRIHYNEFLITDNNGKQFVEIHKQKIFSFETYFDLLDIAGLFVVKCYEAFTLKNGSPESDRVQFIVKKK